MLLVAPNRQKCRSIRVRIRDTKPASGGLNNGLKVSAIVLYVGVETGPARVANTSRK